MLRPLVLLFLTIASVNLPAARSTTRCDSFAFLADGEDVVAPRALIERAYLDLVEQLGKNLDATVYAKISEGNDPFALPEEVRRQNDALAKRLRELEEMLEQKKWNTDDVRATLLVRMAERGGRVIQAARAVERTITENPKGRDYPFPIDPSGRFEQRGRYFVAVEHDSDVNLSPNATVRVLDLESGKASEASLRASKKRFALSSDGNGIAFPVNGDYDYYPIIDGAIDVAGKKTVKPKAHLSKNPPVIASGNPGEFLAFASGTAGSILRFNALTGEQTKIKIDALDGMQEGKRELSKWGILPGSNHLWMLMMINRRPWLMKYELGKDGAKSLGPPRRLHDDDRHQYGTFAFSNDGKSLVVSAGNHAWIYPEGKPFQQLARPKRAADRQFYFVSGVMMLPDGRFLTRTRGSGSNELNTYSLKAKGPKHEATYGLSEENGDSPVSPHLSEDGKWIYLGTSTGLRSVPVEVVTATAK